MQSRIWPILFSSIFLSTLTQADSCDPPPRISELLRHLPADNHERHLALEQLANSSPDDFWLSRLFLDGVFYERSPIRERFKTRYEAHPANLDDEYLYGRSLVGFKTPDALRIYADILAKNPEYPWVHYSVLEIYRSTAFRDRAKLLASFDALTRVCPGWIEPYQYLNALDDDALPSRAAQLRAMLEATQNPRDLRVFSALWAAEFRLTPKADADAEKQRIAADLKRLREIDGVKATIASGAKLIGDDALAKEMTPPPKPDVWAELQAWQRTHVYPAKDASARYKQTFGEAQLEASAKWIAMAPNSVTGYNSRFYALLAMDGPLDQIAKAGADLVRVARTDDRAAGSEYIAVVAERYVERGILLDRVPALMEEAVKGFDDPEAVIEIDLSPIPDLAESNRMNFTRWHVDAIVTLSEYYEKLGQMDKARDVLSPIPAFLATKSVPAGVQDVDLGHNLLLFYGLAHYSYWKRLGELDDHENRKEEALNEYRQALLAWDLGRADLLPKQRGLWKDLGRPDDAWQAWVDSIPKYEQNRPPTFAFAAVHRPLAKIALKDLDGNEWPPDRFASKTTIAVVWATWCAPCVQELPYFAQLVERLKDRTDVQVVSFNTDENPGLAKSFIQKNGYKFPVLIAKNFAEDLMPYLSIPRTWIIRDGSVVEEAEGWGLSWNQWLDRIVAQVK